MSVNITRQGIVNSSGSINENLFQGSDFLSASQLGSNNNISTPLGRYNGAASIYTFTNNECIITLVNTSNLGINFKRVATDINLDSNSYYTISCEAKCTNSSAHLDIGLSYYSTADKWVWRGGTNAQNFIAANTWQKFTLTFKPDADTQYIGYCFTVKCGDNHTLTLRRCKLEKGSVATPWVPSPLDSTYVGDTCGFTELDRNIVSIGNGYITASEFIEI